MRRLLIIGLFAGCLSVAQAQFSRPPLSPVGQKISAAMQSDIRTQAEKKRDANRKPVQTLEFFGLQDDMRVIELLPGGGWYTKLLGPVLAEKGELYLAIGTRRMQPLLDRYPSLHKVKILSVDSALIPTDNRGVFDMDEFSLGIGDADMVLTFRNLHNFTPAARHNINKAVYAALKPGGLYGVVDHTRRHNEPDNPENGRRLDPVTAIKEIQAVGFRLIDSSDLHYRPDDELRYEVGRKTVTGNTDRFTLLFQKP